MKRKAIKAFYSNFVADLKMTDPGKWFNMAKRIGAVSQMDNFEVKVESLLDYDNKQCADKIAQHFSAISNEYLPVDLSQLPAYLPAQPLPRVSEYKV